MAPDNESVTAACVYEFPLAPNWFTLSATGPLINALKPLPAVNNVSIVTSAQPKFKLTEVEFASTYLLTEVVVAGVELLILL